MASLKYYYKPIREFPTGKGYADFVYLPRAEYRDEYPSLVIELKWDTLPSIAIDQIKEKKYPNSLLSYSGSILLVAISYDKKNKEHSVLTCREQEAPTSKRSESWSSSLEEFEK